MSKPGLIPEKHNIPELDSSMNCFHCGDICKDGSVQKDDKIFCCTSCRLVYEILEENNLCKYYSLDKNPGISPAVSPADDKVLKTKYEYLDDERTKGRILEYSDGKTSSVTFFIPQMHCSSCIWLLENLYKLNPGIYFSRTNFLEKKLSVKFSEKSVSLRGVVELLDSIGYAPELNLDSLEKKPKDNTSRKMYYKIGIAGFAFGNVMLLSFPEYLGLDNILEPSFRAIFGYLNLLLSLPVFFYSASDYFISAWKGLKSKFINIDFPISLGLLILFIRSVYEILSHTGAGYIDSMTGLVFFLLVGKLFQNKTYDTLNFDRNYKSYFPLSVSVIKAGRETTIPVTNLEIGDRIVVRNNELIPADSILFRGEGNIDYSFVTGESLPVNKVLGEMIYAGGRQIGNAVEVEVLKEVSRSYLTMLWNNDVFVKSNENRLEGITNYISKYFTAAIILVALISGLYWLRYDVDSAVKIVTAVLIIACPCAIALSVPFILGNTMRIFGKNKFYIKNTSVIEKLAKIDAVVFDKTGTITQTGESIIEFTGDKLSPYELGLVKSLTRQSTHTLSHKIFQSIQAEEIFKVTSFKEITGKGISGEVGGGIVLIGSDKFILGKYIEKEKDSKPASIIYLAINGIVKGYYSIYNSYRDGLEKVVSGLEKDNELFLLSGDNDNEKYNLLPFFKDYLRMRFNQSPDDKMLFIKSLQKQKMKVLMIGDGLNDAGALRQSDVGISISENVSNFSPACDAILDAETFSRLGEFVKFSKLSFKIIIISFAISLFYNVIGIGFAVQGYLSPIVAAILMPVSSISVVLFAFVSTNYMARRKKFIL